MIVQNVGKSDFEFQTLLHTYYSIQDISKTSVSGGLCGATYVDKLQNSKMIQESRNPIDFKGETEKVKFDELMKQFQNYTKKVLTQNYSHRIFYIKCQLNIEKYWC